MYALISDSHLHNWKAFSELDEHGINNRLNHILNEFERCAIALSEYDLDDPVIFHGGDFFHVRGNIAPSVINVVALRLRELHEQYKVRFVLMPGNHDMEFNDTKTVGYSMQSLACDYIIVVDHHFVDTEHSVVVIPWCDSLDELRRKVSSVMKPGAKHGYDLITHAPLNGVIKGIPDNGLEVDEVLEWGFKRVFVGHYHDHKSYHDGRVVSIGATTHQTFSDIGTLAGFVIVDDDSWYHVESEAPKFLGYDSDRVYAQSQILVKGDYIRMRMGEATEEQIRDVKNTLINLGAAGVVVEAIPRRGDFKRAATAVESGQSLMQSIHAFVEADEDIIRKPAVLAECQKIIQQIGEIQ